MLRTLRIRSLEKNPLDAYCNIPVLKHVLFCRSHKMNRNSLKPSHICSTQYLFNMSYLLLLIPYAYYNIILIIHKTDKRALRLAGRGIVRFVQKKGRKPYISLFFTNSSSIRGRHINIIVADKQDCVYCTCIVVSTTYTTNLTYRTLTRN